MPNGTVTNISTGTGLAGGPITSTGTVSLETLSPSPAGTYTNAAVQVDSIGRVISASNGSVASGTMSFYPSASVYDTSTLPATASVGQIVAAQSNLFICTNATGPTWKAAVLTSL